MKVHTLPLHIETEYSIETESCYSAHEHENNLTVQVRAKALGTIQTSSRNGVILSSFQRRPEMIDHFVFDIFFPTQHYNHNQLEILMLTVKSKV